MPISDYADLVDHTAELFRAAQIAKLCGVDHLKQLAASRSFSIR